MPEVLLYTAFANLDLSPFNGYMIAHLGAPITLLPEATNIVAQEWEFRVINGQAYEADGVTLAALPVTASGSCNPGNTPISVFTKDGNGRRTYYKSVILPNTATANLGTLVAVEPDAAAVPSAITGITYLDDWSNATAYTVNQVVGWKSSLWIATTAGTNQEPSDTSAYWGLMFRGIFNAGVWSAGPTYYPNHLVTNGGETWIALRTNVGVTPVVGLDWVKAAEKGATGAAGSTGATGATGATGVPGVGSVAMPSALTFTKDGAGKLTSVTADGLVYPLTRTASKITRIGGLSTSPAFTRATIATKRNFSRVISGVARYEEVIRTALFTTQGDWDAGVKERVFSTIDDKLSSGLISDDFDADTSGKWTATTNAGTLTATHNTGSSRLELTNSVADGAMYTVNNYSVKDVAITLSSTQAINAGHVARYADVNNFYFTFLRDDTSSATLNAYIYKRVAGANTIIAGPIDVTFTRGVANEFKLDVIGSELKLTHAGALIASVTDTALTAAGKVGIYHNGTGTSYIETFQIDQLSPLFSRPSIANLITSGAAVVRNAPRYEYGRNLLTKNQSDVETDLIGLTALGADIRTRSTSEFWQGTASLKLAFVGTVASRGFILDAFNDDAPNGHKFKPLTTYTYSMYVKDSVAALSMRVFFYDSVNNTIVSAATFYNTSLAWQRVTYTFTTPATFATNGIYGIRVDNNGAGHVADMYFDGMQLEQGSTATTWNPGGPQAVMAEGGTTSIFTAGSENFNTNWVQFSGAVNTITASQADPYGGTSAVRIQTSGGSNALKHYQNALAGAATVNLQKYSQSVWVKNNSATSVIVKSSISGATQTIANADGWKLVKFENITGDGASTLQLRFEGAVSGDTLDFFAYQPQAEAKAYCTSYIAPGTTRSAETLLIPNNGILAGPEGAFTIDFYVDGDAAAAGTTNVGQHFLLDTGESNSINRILLYRASAFAGWRAAVITPAGATLFTPASSVLSVGWHKAGVRWISGFVYLAIDGVLIGSVAATLPTRLGDYINLGSDRANANHLNTPIGEFHALDAALTAPELLTFTTA